MSLSPTAGAPAPLEVFRDAGYRRLWVSGCAIYVARWMDLVILGWLALDLTGSPFMVAVAAFARTAPMMIVGPFAGIVADHVAPGRVLAVTQLGALATALVLTVLFGVGAGSYWPFVALETVVGVLWALDFSARRTAIFALLGPGRVAQAISLETVSMQLAKMAGPLLAGACLVRLGPTAAFAMVAALYALGAASAFALRRRIPRPAARGPVDVAASLRAGLHAAWTSPVIRAVLLATIAMNVLVFPYQHMLSVFVRDVLAGGAGILGLLVAAEGLGSLVGALFMAAQRAHLPHARVFAAAILATPAILVAFSLSSWLWLCLILLVVIGVAESGFAAMQTTLVLLSAPERHRGGTVGILSACIGTQPVGTLAIGALAAAAGAPMAFSVNALVAIAVILPVARSLVRGAPALSPAPPSAQRSGTDPGRPHAGTEVAPGYSPGTPPD